MLAGGETPAVPPPRKLPYADLAASDREMRRDIDAAIERVVASGRFVLGPECAAFEAAWATFVGAPHAVGVGSGADALYFALVATGVEPGDEVIVPGHTFIATWLAVTRAGAIPVPVEPDPVSRNIDPAGVAAAVTPRTSAIVPVHLYGVPAAISELASIARRSGLALVEDAAQAHGALTGDERVGSHGDATAWSFFPGKNLGAFGDGGCVTARDGRIAETVRSLRNHGRVAQDVHATQGITSRLDEIQAAVLSVKLRGLDGANARRRANAARYFELLRDVPVALPVVREGDTAVWQAFVVGVDDRESLRAWLSARGVETRVHYPVPPHRQPVYADTAAGRCHLPTTDDLASRVLSLPVGPHVGGADVDYVVECVRAFYGA